MHIPVLLTETLAYLNPQSGQVFIDCTLGAAGHFREIANMIAPTGKILGIDVDRKAIETALEKNIYNAVIVQGNFKDLKNIAKKNGFSQVDGILMDLGFSSIELEEGGIGLSFQKDEPLDMRMDEYLEITAADIVNNSSQEELAEIFSKYGEEKYSKRIARAIVELRRENKLKSTFQLAEIIKQAAPARSRFGRIHPATRVFQALRIAVNNELENLKKALPQAFELLKPGGRLAAISFHSGEDRIVKNFFRDNKNNFNILTKKPIVPSQEEIAENPRSRSGKMRAAEKIK